MKTGKAVFTLATVAFALALAVVILLAYLR
jgi:hypothetical protein